MNKIKQLLCALLTMLATPALAGVCPSSITQGTTVSCDSIQQFGITVNLAVNSSVGQFINGDYFVVGAVTVSSVSPATTAGKNGAMKNPVPGGMQGFDSGAYRYDASLAVTYPLSLSPGDSFLPSISRLPEDTVDLGGRGLGDQHYLKTVSVLTVLSTAPPSGSFRPSYCDRAQKLYNISQINTSILPTLPPPVPPSAVTWYERHFERPWILFGLDYAGRVLHPYDNMPGYHRFVGKQLSDACMFLMTNSVEKEKTLRGMVQVGIDYFYTHAADSSTWQFPVIFTGLLLNEPDMYNYWINNQDKIPLSREGDKLYYVGDRVVSRTSAIIPAGQTWIDWKTPGGRYIAFAKQVGQEHEHLHPSEWTAEDRKNETYRANLDVDPWIGMHLSARLVDPLTPMDMVALFVRPQSLEYSDRWMTDGITTAEYADSGHTYLEEMALAGFSVSNSYNSSGSPWIDAMWTAYRSMDTPPDPDPVTSSSLRGIDGATRSINGHLLGVD